MMRQDTMYFIVVLLSAVLSASIGLYAWQRRKTLSVRTFALLMAGVTIWLVGYAFELRSDRLGAMLFWIKVGYLGVIPVPILWMIFALRYTGREQWLTPRNLALLSVMPALLIFLNWTTEWHHLYYKEMWVDFTGPFPRFAFTKGFTYWIGVAHAYVALLVGTVVLVQMWWRSARPYRSQIGMVLAGAIAPWAANALYISGQNPFPYLNLTPLSFTITGVLIALGLFRFKFLDVVPVARARVVESMRDAVVVLDEQARVIDLNASALELAREPQEQCIGAPVADVLGEPFLELDRYRDTREVLLQVTRDVRDDRRHYDVHLAPLRSPRGKLTGWLIVLRDLTDIRRAQATLKAQAEALAARNAELDAFAHTVAHDLKTPLTVLLGFSRLLESNYDRFSRDAVLNNLRRISVTGSKMQDIIDALLLLASVRAQEEVETKPLDMAAVVAEAQARLSGAISEARATLIVPDAWPAARGYAPWIEEVWVNYVSNALKYGGNPPRVTLGAMILAGEAPISEEVPEIQSLKSKIQQHESKIIFWVRDNGAGIAPDEQAQLFTEFVRLDRTRATGHGLGLSIVRRIITRLGGEVGVESSDGQGCIFWFTLSREV